MALEYKVIVQQTEPTNFSTNVFWLHPVIGVLKISLNGAYVFLAAGDGNLSIADGTYNRSETESSTPPVSPQIGDFWLQDNQNARVYLGRWVVYGGGG